MAGGYECITEQVMGEEIDHLTKMVSTCKINHHIDSMSEVITFLGNCWTWPQLAWDIDARRPIFVGCIKELVDGLSESGIKHWFEHACLCAGGCHLKWTSFNVITHVSP